MYKVLWLKMKKCLCVHLCKKPTRGCVHSLSYKTSIRLVPFSSQKLHAYAGKSNYFCEALTASINSYITLAKIHIICHWNTAAENTINKQPSCKYQNCLMTQFQLSSAVFPARQSQCQEQMKREAKPLAVRLRCSMRVKSKYTSYLLC